MISIYRKAFVVWLISFVNVVIAQETEPSALAAAPDNFEREFVRDVDVVQKKYVGALDNLQRQFTKAGNLEAAKEVNSELLNANEWASIPVETGKRKLFDDDLMSLNGKYEAAVSKVLDKVIAHHIEKLEYLKKGYLSRNELDFSISVEKEIKIALSKQRLPLNAGAKRYLESLDREGFRQWLLRQDFQFAGTAAGVTNVTLTPDELNYHPTDKEFSKGYSYEISGNRGVKIAEGNFHMEFTKDLQSGTFKSARGEYPITINSRKNLVD